MHGVVRSDGHGVPKCIFQKEDTEKPEKEKARGALKFALLKGDFQGPRSLGSIILREHVKIPENHYAIIAMIA